jgi:proline iminopeptidase
MASKNWRLETFVEELEDLRVALGYKKIDILGHSWGTMLSAEYYFNYPRNVRSMIFSSPCLDARAWSSDAQRLLKKLTPPHQRAIASALRTKNFTGKTFKLANEAYYDKYVRKFVGRGKKRPYSSKLAGVGFAFEGYLKMWGPVEFIATGSLKHFDRAKDLPRVKIPTLFTCGRYDEATPETVQAQARITPGAKFHLFKKSSHLATLEQPREYVATMKTFLNQVESS